MEKLTKKACHFRNLSLVFNLLLLAAVVFLWIDRSQRTVSQSCNVENCYNYETRTPFEYPTVGFLASLSAEYNSKMMAIPDLNNMQVDGLPDARSVWFPLETLQRFIWEIRANACKPGCSPLESLGVRIYFGRYVNPVQEGLPGDYKGRHTLFMVPTFYDGTAHCDFDPKNYHDTTGCTPASLKQRFINADLGHLASQSMLALTVTGQNHGGLCPPKCKPSLNDDFFTAHFPQ